MERSEVKRLLKRRERAAAKTAQWRDLLQAAYRQAVPNRDSWDNYSPGTNLNDEVYDTTLASATKKFVHNAINALMPPNRQFLKLVAGAEIPDEEKQAKDAQLQKITDTFFFYLDKSNFNLVIYEALLDMSISTGVLQINEGDEDNPLIFSAIPSDEISFDTGPRNEFNAFFRDWYKLKPEYAYELWPEFELPPKYQGRDAETIEMTLYEISYYCYRDRKYKYVVIDKDSSDVCYYRESESWEWVAFRMNVLSGEDRGRGVVLDALPSALTINQAIYDELAAAAMQANPTYMAYTDSIVNAYNFKIEPNAIIPVQRGSSESWPIAPLPQAGNLNFTALVVQDLRAQINEIMMTIPLMPMSDLPDRTATEVAVQQTNVRENASAAFNRLQRELFDPLVNRVVYILKKKGLIEDLQIDGKDVAISYRTPLAQAKESVQYGSFMQLWQSLVGVYGPQTALSLIDATKLPRWMAEKLDADQSMVKSEQEILEAINQAAQAAQQQQQQQQMEAQ